MTSWRRRVMRASGVSAPARARMRVAMVSSVAGCSRTSTRHNLSVATVRDTPRADLAASVERFAAVGSCSTPSFSPDGGRVAFISDLSGVPQLWVVDAGGGWPERVTSFADQVVGAQWSPTEDLIAIDVAPGGGLNQQIYVVRPDGTGLRRLTAGGAENNRLQRWSRDGRTLYVASNRDDPSSFHVYAIEVASGGWRAISSRPGIATLSDVS